MTMFEIKADDMIDDAVTAAKERYALEMGLGNHTFYLLIKAIREGMGLAAIVYRSGK